MANKLYEESSIQAIANAIRSKNGSSDTYTVSQMSTAINNIPSGGSIPNYPLNNGKNNIWIIIDTPNQSASITVGTSGDTVNWGDGTTDTNTTHTYLTVGIYCITANSLTSVTDNSIVLYAEYNNNVTLPSYDNATIKKAKLNNSNITSISASQFDTSLLKEISMPYVTTIGSCAFQNCSLTGNLDLSNVTLPGYSGTDNGQFRNCKNITSVTIGEIDDSNGSLRSEAFKGCTSLVSATILRGTSTGRAAFQDCTSLTSITLSNTITTIPQYCFSGCYLLTGSISSTNITSIGVSAFYGTKITSVNISNATIAGASKSSSNGAFQNCTSLTSAIVGELGSNSGYSKAFRDCTSLTTVTVNGGTTIGQEAFSGCTSLTTLTIPASVTDIRDYAFSGCTSLTTLTIPANVTQIKDRAFEGCTSMQEYHFLPTTPPTLANKNAFSNIPANCIIYVPVGSLEAYQTATNWSNYASYIQAEPTAGE